MSDSPSRQSTAAGIERRLVLSDADFILANHHVHGFPVLPGVAFLDVSLRILRSCGFDPAVLELRNVLFSKPIVGREGCDTEIRISVSDELDGLRRLRAESRRRDGAQVPLSSFEENFSADVFAGPLPQPPGIDIAALTRGAVRVGDVDELYDRTRSEQIRHGAAMRCRGRLYRGERSLLVELGLAGEFERLDRSFHLHPAKMDASTIAAFCQVQPLTDEPFIPVFIESFRAIDTIAGRVFAYIPEPEHWAASGDVMRNSYGIYDEQGRFLAGFTKLTCKKIRNAALISRLADDAAGGFAAAAAEPPPPATAPVEGPADSATGSPAATKAEVVAELRRLAARHLGAAAQSIRTDAGFYDLGLESGNLLEMSRELEAYVGRQLYPTLLFEFSDIDSLAAHLHETYSPRSAAAIAAAVPQDGRVAEPADTATDTTTDTTTGTAAEAELRCWQPVWEPAALPGGTEYHDAGGQAVVLFGGDTEIAEALSRVAGPECRVVLAGGLDLTGGLDLAALLASLADEGYTARTFVRLAAPHSSGPDTDSIPPALREARALAAAVVEARPDRPCSLLFPYAQDADRGDLVAEEAAVAAFARTVSAEAPMLACRAIGHDAALPADALAQLILAEAADPGDESAVRYAKGRREAVRYAPVDAGEGACDEARRGVRHGGVYLITGGAGGLGALIADRLTEHFAAKLVIMGRRDDPPGLADRISRRRASGGDALYVRGDVRSLDDVRRAVREARRRYGRLDGVFHCAGVVRDGLFFRQNLDTVAEVVQTKVAGTRALDAAIGADELDLFVLFSSLSASLANPGQSAYAYANSFMEHFAQARSESPERSGLTVAIGWPLWRDGGMTVDEPVLRAAAEDRRLHPLPAEPALDLLFRAVAGGPHRLVAAYGEPRGLDRLLPVAESTGSGETTETAGSGERLETPELGDVAIIGVAGRYPQAPDLATFWRNLAEGRDCVTEVPAERWDIEAVFDAEKGRPGRTYARHGAFLDGVAAFDAPFFGISRREAERMDPQERLFLETSWHAIEDAGYRPDNLADGSRVGVYAGVMWSHYQLFIDAEGSAGPTALHCSVANRVSYTLGFTGPSMSVDTACSSSLTSLHMAVEALRRGECAVALAGGVNLSLHPQKYLQLAEGRFLAADGRCRSFGEGGSGYVPGEGVGVAVLKPLTQALADGDTVLGVIKGSALNHSGHTGGFTVPSPVGQAEVVGRAMAAAGVRPGTVGYVEAHGTGTSLGDPIEVEGLRRVFGQNGRMPGSCALGSVKSNIGHLESAAGIAAVTKVLLQLEHRRLAPSLHSARLNPAIDFGGTPFFVPQRLTPWTPADGCAVLRAGVSSFGAGGANAHLLIEEPPPLPARGPAPDRPEVFVFSARDDAALHDVARRYTDFLGTLRERLAPRDARPITAEVATLLGVSADAVDPGETLGDLGLDRLALEQLRGLLAAGGGTENAPAHVTSDTRVADLVATASRPGDEAEFLADLAYTLRVGRVPMRTRLAVVASDPAGLLRGLRSFIAGEPSAHVYLGTASDEQRVADAAVSSGERRSHELAESWVAGAEPAWPDGAWGTAGDVDVFAPRRLRLPVYPFRANRYWFGQWRSRQQREEGAADEAAGGGVQVPSSRVEVRVQVQPPVPEHARLSEVTRAVEEVVRAQLYLDEGELDTLLSLSEMGVDSVGATEITRKLGDRFDVEVDTVAVYDHPTVTRLAAHVAGLAAARPPRAASTGASSVAVAEPDAGGEPQGGATGNARPSDIAVIGMSGRFPGARDLAEFWDGIVHGRHAFEDVPAERWNVEEVYDPDRRVPGKTYSRTGAMLTDIDLFDAAFFGISPLEAEQMDPQQRTFLQEAWAALEDAGYALRSEDRKTNCGVYAGCAVGDYSLLLEAAGSADTGYAFLGTTSSILPARIGYFLNLDGPTVAIDTACSSSLVAVHLAAEAIRGGEIEMAVAGGVALMVTPKLHVWASKVGMLSPRGSCVPFDASADGTVLGEGVGCVVLKRLDRALAGGDHIHAVLRGSGVNGDGRTNGITAPSAASQASLIQAVHERAGITADEIGYVEAHGTGTTLGDPIEVKALTEVFRRSTDAVGTCGLGTVKANIGHTTMAAGIAGLIKAVLAVRHGQLPPAPAFAAPNPRMAIEQSPFFVVTQPTDWRPADGRDRIATVSSFGFSGTNAHAVVASAPRTATTPDDGRSLPSTPWLVPVTARTPEALATLLGRLADALEPEADLRDVAHTLVAGRTHLPERAAFLAHDVRELSELMAAASRGQCPPGCFRTGGPAAEPSGAGDSADSAGAGGRLAALERLAREFVGGAALDWSTVGDGARARRLSLPTYPFARTRHWVEVPAVARPATTATTQPRSQPHPFIADVRGTAESAQGAVLAVTIPEGQWALAEHQVAGRAVLPGAAVLDLAVSAASRCGLRGPFRLGDVRWIRPIGGGVDYTLSLRRIGGTGEGAQDTYEFALTAAGEGEVFSRGTLRTGAPAPAQPDHASSSVDLHAVMARCAGTLPAERCYEEFRIAGLAYGPHFQVLRDLWFGPDEVLARIETAPAAVDGFTLGPNVLDGAQQALAALEAGDSSTLVPFSVDEVEILDALTVPVYAYATRVSAHRYDVLLTDASGRTCVRYRGFALRALHDPVDAMVYRPTWREVPALAAPAAPTSGRTVILHSLDATLLARALAEVHGAAAVAVPIPDTGEITEALLQLDQPTATIYFLARTGPVQHAPEADRSALALFRVVKRLIAAGRHRDALELKIVLGGAVPADRSEPVRPHAAGLLGIARAVETECPRWRICCVDIGTEPATTAEPERTTALRIAAEPGTEPVVLLRGARRLERVFEPVRLPDTPSPAPLRRGGTYLVAGGAGGIGFALSRLAAQTAGVNLAWIGRSPLGPEHQAKIKEIASLGGRALYQSADVRDESAMRAAIERIRAEFGPVHGAVHAALDMRDRTIAAMNEETFLACLEPKAQGLATFARVLGAEPLDFMMVFSSAISFVEAGGQANYAAASCFEDSYAQWLGRQAPYPVSVVNWGFWGSVGAVANDRMRAAFGRLGIGSVEPAEGLTVIRRAVSAGEPQLLAMKAEREALPAMGIRIAAPGGAAHQAAAIPAAAHSAAPVTASVAVRVPAPGGPPAREAVAGYVAEVFAGVLKYRAADLDEEATFEAFGVDSLVSLSIVDRLEQDLGELPATLLFEHNTIADLADHLIADHADRLAAVLGGAVPAAEPELGPEPEPATAPLVPAVAPVPAGTEPSATEEPAVAPVPDGSDLDRAMAAFAEVERYSRQMARRLMPRLPDPAREQSAGEAAVAEYVELCRAVAHAAGADGSAQDADFLSGAEVLTRFPEMAAHIALLERCCDALPEVVTGRRNPMEVLFPKGSTALVEAIYRGQPLTDHHNRITARLAVEEARRIRQERGRAVRVLEVGAGTGGTTRSLLAAFTAEGCDFEYVYTDISPAFLRYGEREFGTAYPTMSFRLLDITVDPAEQGFDPADYDVVLGSHVMHATPDMSGTIRHVRSLLRSGGLALINEITTFSPFLTLTFGLTSGWWAHRDAGRRLPHGPLLSPAHWRREMAAGGLCDIRALGVPGVAEDELGQAVMAGRADESIAVEARPAVESAAVRASATAGDIAVIGVAGRYPQSPTLEDFWRNLVNGVSCITEIPEDRWDWRAHFDAARGVKDKSYSRWGGFLDRIDLFDAPLFGILGREANDIDPQERLFLEVCWELLESAGRLGSAGHEPATGVFAGLMYGGYGQVAAAHDWPKGRYVSGYSAFWSTANRVSYTFDLHGPSLAVDSACSSALTAVHLACESLRRGECRTAIAGGTNVIVHPAHFAALSARTMLSSGPGCRVFDAGADGFVPGEGVGAVLLKPLVLAEQDGDTIWAVIKGGFSTAGGKVGGYTVPNPNAQAEAIEQALARSGVHPSTITYVEAHGTGTALGDPIELAGLTAAFRAGGATGDAGASCAVGSVKSNIGHLEGAAGIAALTKVLLQLKHGMIAPSINLGEVNPKIAFAGTPFHPARSATPWERPTLDVGDGAGERLWPRRAGVSSFGAGGANVHLVIEEYAGVDAVDAVGRDTTDEESVFVLSAMSPAALRTHAGRVADFLTRDGAEPVSLRDLAYTSQVGRRAMPERLAVVAASIEELGDRLRRFARDAGRQTGPGAGIFSGRAAKVRTSDAGGRRTAETAPEELAAGWVRGEPTDWGWGTSDRPARRVLFPTYPFERSRHWFTDEPEATVPPAEPAIAVAAPAPDPASGLAAPAETAAQPASPAPTSREPASIVRPASHPALALASAHRVGGRSWVPGVALLELARECRTGGGELPLSVSDVRWLTPIDIDRCADVFVTLTDHGAAGTAFEVRGSRDGDAAATGRLAALPADAAEPVPDLSALQRSCTTPVPADRLYGDFADAGLEYGRQLQVVADLRVGDGECLARLALRRNTRRGESGFVLHPVLLDGALQCVSSLCQGEVAYLPVGLRQLRAYAPLPADCWAWVREVTPLGGGTGGTGDARSGGHRIFDIRLTDGGGAVLQALDGLEIAPALPSRPAPLPTVPPLRYLRPVWRPAPMAGGDSWSGTVLVVTEEDGAYQALAGKLAARGCRVVQVRPMFGDAEAASVVDERPGEYGVRADDPREYDRLVDALAADELLPGAVVHLASAVRSDDACGGEPRQEIRTDASLEIVLWSTAALLRRLGRAPLRVVYAHLPAADGPEPLHVAVAGALRTLALEHSSLRGARLLVADVSAGLSADETAERISAELFGAGLGVIEAEYRSGVRMVRTMEPFDPPAVAGDAWTARADDGVYLITGGAGALGRHFARLLGRPAAGRGGAGAGHGRGPVVVLTGRSEPDERIEARLADLEAAGVRAVYLPADVGDQESVHRLVARIRAEYGPLRGVVHAAGVIRDARAVDKTPEQVAEVLRPKVAGAVHLDRATRADPLDFFVLFSSLTAEGGNPGQADYGYANAFLGAFAARRSRWARDDLDETTAASRSGVSLAICWPLWADGGMSVDDATRELFARRWNMAPLDTQAGLDAFVRVLSAGGRGEACVSVMQTVPADAPPERTPAPPTRKATEMPTTQSTEVPPPAPALDASALRELVRGRIRTIAAGFLLVDEADVHDDVELLELGFDSITLTELVNKVNGLFGLDLLPTVLFECPDLASFVDYLLEHHGSELAAATAVPSAPEPQSRPAKESASASPSPGTMEIAVIGMAGVLPGSADVHEFWRHLAAGDDLIRPVPPDRSAIIAEPLTREVKGGFIDDIDRFDHRLFGIAPSEAALMDPQQRLFLHAVWSAVQDAGYRPQQLTGTDTGLFVGVATHDYDDLLKDAGVPVEGHWATGIAHSVLPNRISYLLDLHGPSEAVDTACSSSLVAIHRAVAAIRGGECEMAIAGGVNAMLTPGLFLAFLHSGMLSETGRCATFDAAADGYVRGEGVGAVVLKPLDRALADGDHIDAIIRASAVNHGGRSNSLTAPNPEAQARVIVQAHRAHDVDPATITYIETHGTGTKLGDPVEIEGLKKAFRRLSDRSGAETTATTVGLGSVKSAIGHLEAAAGIAGFIKVLLCMRHRELPPTLHYREPNPYLRLDGSPFYINDLRRTWRPAAGEDGRAVLRAGISSFGFGGSNAHMILEAYPDGEPGQSEQPGQSDGRPVIVPLSAASEADLTGYAGRLGRHLAEHPELDLARVAYTLQTGRVERPHRCAVPASSREELIESLNRIAAGESARGTVLAVAGAGTAVPGAAVTGREAPAALMRLWCEGATVEWDEQWTGRTVGRVSLPVAPFAPTRHWFAGSGGGTEVGAEAEAVAVAPVADERGPGVRLRALAPAQASSAAESVPPVRLRAPGTVEEPRLEAPVPTPLPVPLPVPVVTRASRPDAGQVSAVVLGELSRILAMPESEIGLDEPFGDLGLDSIYRLELVRTLNRTFALEVKAEELYDYDTVARLAGFVASAESAEPEPEPRSEPEPKASSGSEGVEPQALLEFISAELERPLQPELTFEDNGLGSFDMLRVVAELEKRHGPLRKTALFDHPTVAELARHLSEVSPGRVPTAPASPPETDTPVSPVPDGAGLVIAKKNLDTEPEVAKVVAELDARYAREGGLPGRDIAPLIFLGADRSAFFNLSSRNGAMLAWSYVGPPERMPSLSAELVRYAAGRGASANVVSLIRLEEADGVRFTATPFGALQRIEDLSTFSLDGGRMSRLRYMIGRFERTDGARTVEYRVGGDRATDLEIAELIGSWAQGKSMVNPYVHTVRDEISRGLLQPRHRMFLTYSAGRMVGAVIVTKIPSEDGYLLDLEFYPPDAPLGCLEYTIVKIIERTAEEGASVFSFGASFGVKLGDSPNAAPETEEALADLRSRGIFTGEGNFRFKSKFRTNDLTLYLCQPADSRRTDVGDVILMIASPAVTAPGAVPAAVAAAPAVQAPVPSPAPADVAARERALAEHGWNPLLIPADEVEFDLTSDSWAELARPSIAARVERLRGTAATASAEPLLTGVQLLGFPCAQVMPSGRAAEAALCRALAGRGTRVIHNGLFPTWYTSFAEQRLTPVRLRTQASASVFRGDVDVAELDQLLAAEDTAFVCIELAANSGGGAALSLENLVAVRDLTRRHGVALALDAARILGNASLIAAHEPGQAGRAPAEIAREILSLADGVAMSLSKEFGLDCGGVVATADPTAAERLRARLAEQGPSVHRSARALAAAALGETHWAAAAVRERLSAVAELGRALEAGGVPVRPGISTHCLLLDTTRIEGASGLGLPMPAVLAWLYARTGIRAAAHLAADPADRGLIRLAIPVGLTPAEGAEIARRVTGLFREPGTIGELLPADPDERAPAALASFHPAERIPQDVRSAMAERHRPADENFAVLREFQPEVQRRLVAVPDAGGEVEVFTVGQGRTLLLMTPFNIGAGFYGPQFAGLARHYRVTVVHHPGVGATTAAADLSFAGVADLCRTVLGLLGVTGPVHVAGASFGGLAAQMFALRHPGATASLALFGSSYKLGNRIGEVNRLAVVAGEDFDHLLSRVADSTPLAERRAGLESLLLRSESMNPRIGLRYLDVFASTPDLRERLTEISVPTLIVQGRHDTVIPLKTAHLLHACIPDSQYHEVADAGHFPSLSSPDEVNEVLLGFLAERDRQTARNATEPDPWRGMGA